MFIYFFVHEVKLGVVKLDFIDLKNNVDTKFYFVI